MKQSGSESSRKPTRDRERTERELVAAVGRVLARDGFQAFGVNAVARAAGTDKVLIYRYFGDLAGLLRAYGESADFWPSVDQVLGPDAEALRALSIGPRIARIVTRLLRALSARPQTIEIMAWETVQVNALTAMLADGSRHLGSMDPFRREMHIGLGCVIENMVQAAPAYERTRALRVGRVWQRMHLWATTQGLAVQPINQALEIADRERQQGGQARMAQALRGFGASAGLEPTFAFRLGYPVRSPSASPRGTLMPSRCSPDAGGFEGNRSPPGARPTRASSGSTAT